MTAHIRLATAADAVGIADIYGLFVESTVVSFEVDRPAAAEIRRRLERILPTHPWLVCAWGDGLAGYAYATAHHVRQAYRWSVDVSIYVAPACHRHGVGRGLYASLFAILAAQGFVNAYAGVTLPNAASVGLHERFGFRLVGVFENVGYKFGAWHDVGWWHLVLRPHTISPRTPLDLDVVQRQADWTKLLSAGTAVVRPPT